MNYENDIIQPGKYINTNTINNKLHPIIHFFSDSIKIEKSN